jgi:hypothetical protein
MLGQWDCGDHPCFEECESYNGILRDVLKVAYEAVCQDMPDDFCGQFTGFVAVNEPVAPGGDYVATWIQDVSPYNPRNTEVGRMQVFPRFLMAVGVKLLETGWPMISAGDGLPPLTDVNAAALQANSHAERVSRALINAVARNAVGDNGCLFRGMGRMAPVAPSAGMVGWTWAVQVEVPW